MAGETTKVTGIIDARTVLLCLGFGCLLSTYSGAPLESGFLAGWQDALLLQAIFQTSIALGCLGLGALARKRDFTIDPLVSAVAYAVIAVLCLVAEGALAHATTSSLLVAAACALSLVFGLVSALPLLFWYDRLLEVRREQGRKRCIVLLASSELVAVSVYALLVLLLPKEVPAGFSTMIGLVVIAAACQGVAGLRTPKQAADGPTPLPAKEKYRLTAYSISMIVCLGAAWGLTGSMFHLVEGASAPESSPLVALAVAVGALVCITLLARLFVKRQFGALVRLAIGVSGVIVTAFPLLYAINPQMFYPFGHFLFILLEVSIVFFSIDICFERGLRISAVMPANYALFLLTSCAATIVFWLSQVLLGERTGLEFIALLGAVTVAAVIAFLPSRESNAVTFTLDTLPENTSFESNLAQRRNGLVAKYGLSEREAEVLELLFRGMTRQQIADELHLSPWTIKDRVSAIYEKTGVHSYKELTRLLEDKA